MEKTVILFLSVMLSICFLSSSALSEPDRISGIRLDVESVEGRNTDNLEKLAETMITLKKGDALSDEKLDETIRTLRKSELFEKISADSQDDGTVVFKLKPSRLIKDIRIQGIIYPFFEKDILNSMSIYAGEPFKPRKFERQAELVKKMLEKEGYINPGVKIEKQVDPEDQNINVTVNIDKNDFWKIADIRFKGNESFSDFRLGMAMETSRASFMPDVLARFSENTLKNETKALVDFYRVQGFADAVVNAEVSRDEKNAEVNVIIRINEGPLYDIDFRGNQEFWNMTLKKEVVFEKDGNKYNLGVRKSASNIRKKYIEEGYLDAAVKTEEELSEDSRHKKIVFVIDEGKRTLVSKVKIEGNHSIGREEIEKNMLTKETGMFFREPYNPETIEGDVEAVVNYYRSMGFLNAHVEHESSVSEDGKNAEVRLSIIENPVVLAGTKTFKGLHAVTPEEAVMAMTLKKGEPFSQSALDGDEKKLSALVSEKGYPHVSVKSEVKFTDDGKTANIFFTVDEGPFVKMGGSFFHGNIRTNDSLLRKELSLKEGDPFSLTKVLEGQKSIRNMDIFNSVQFKSIGLAEKSDTVHVLAEIEEKKPYYIKAGIGYDSQQGMYSSAKAGDINLFGKNKEAWISGEASQTTYKAETGVGDPRFTGLRFSAKTRIYAEQKEEFNKNYGNKPPWFIIVRFQINPCGYSG